MEHPNNDNVLVAAIPPLQILPNQGVFQHNNHLVYFYNIYPSSLIALIGIVSYSAVTYYGFYPFKATTLTSEEQFLRAATDYNVVSAVKIFKDHAGTSAISEKAVNDMLSFLCSSATQEHTQRDTALIIEFLDIAKENNYSLYKQTNYHLKKFDIATQAPDCLELVGVVEKIQELVVEGG